MNQAMVRVAGGAGGGAHKALPALVVPTPIGTVALDIVRDGKPTTVDVTVAKLAEPVERDLTPSEREERELEPHEGVLVAEVVPDGPTAEAGIEAGTSCSA